MRSPSRVVLTFQFSQNCRIFQDECDLYASKLVEMIEVHRSGVLLGLSEGLRSRRVRRKRSVLFVCVRA